MTEIHKPGGESINLNVRRKVVSWSPSTCVEMEDNIAPEVAVALVYNGISHAVMMASPVDLDAFAIGFSFTEGIIDSMADIYDLKQERDGDSITLSLEISNRCFAHLKNKRRNLTGKSGCGVCGSESLETVMRPLPVVENTESLSHGAIDLATQSLDKYQPLQELTGAVHGAAWCDLEGNIISLCEDVGRHNALDKLIGKRLMKKDNERKGFLLITSRASYEMIQKAAVAGVSVVVAVSAPTTLAIDIAEKVGITLVGFSRKQRHVVYSHAQRLYQ